MRHPDFPGLEITLSVAGRTLNEYEDESEDNGGLNGADKVGQYVEAVPGANFEINVVVGRTFKYSTNAITAYTYLDGQPAGAGGGNFVEPAAWEVQARRVISGTENTLPLEDGSSRNSLLPSSQRVRAGRLWSHDSR